MKSAFLLILTVVIYCSDGAEVSNEMIKIGEPPLVVCAMLKDVGGRQLVISPDTRFLLTDDGETARIWDMKTFMPIGDPIRGGSSIDQIGFVDNGRLAFISSTTDRPTRVLTARYFNAATCTRLDPDLRLGSANSVTSSGDGKFLAGSFNAVNGNDHITEIKVIEQSTSRVLLLKSLERKASEIRLNGDGSCLMYEEELSPEDGVMRLIRVRDGKQMFVGAMQIPNLEHEEVDFSPDGKNVVIADGKGFKIFSISSEKMTFDSPVLGRCSESREPTCIGSVRFSSNNAFVFAARPNGLYRMNCVTGDVSGPLLSPWGLVNDSFSNDGEARSGWYTIQDSRRRQIGQGFGVIELDTGRVLWKWSRPDQANDGYTALSLDGKYLALSDPETRSVYIVDVADVRPKILSQTLPATHTGPTTK